MGKLLIKERQIVIPGAVLAEGMDYLPAGGAFRDGENVVSSVVGLVNVNGRVLKVIPLKSRYKPKSGDVIVGKVVDMTHAIWFVDIGYYHNGILPIRDVPEYVGDGEDLSQFYNFGDYICAKVIGVSRGSFNLSLKVPGMRKLQGGRIIHIGSAKVPRVIGKQASMINLIKDKTGCRVAVGQNGCVWIQGIPEHEFVASEAIKLIDEMGHEQGLTEMVSDFLEKEMKGVKIEEAEEKAHKGPDPKKKEEKKSDDVEEKATRRAFKRPKSKKPVKKGNDKRRSGKK
tara:strand:+ start:4052 stop:4906 length:855 start_codon:yes stop_codon:yes gene_type:complete